MHKKPLTPLEEEGLRKHGLDIGTPSQLSDVFRHGVAWALAAPPAAAAQVPELGEARIGDVDIFGMRHEIEKFLHMRLAHQFG